MRTPALWQVSVSSSGEAEEAVSELFQRIFDDPPSVYIDAVTESVTISAYCSAPRSQVARRVSAIGSGLQGIHNDGLDPGRGRIHVRRIRREDWAESWKRHFRPLEIGAALIVKPSWSRRRPKSGQAVVVLDPGLSFGTGQHPTTLFCLQQLVRYRQKDKVQSFLDIGTGSGILAIAAARIGYRPVNALDFDPAAVRIARANARTNRVLDRIRIIRHDLRRLALDGGEVFDVISANLTADLLLEQRRRILNRLAPDGVLILAGVLQTQFADVRHGYSSEGLRLVSSRAGGEWRSGAFRRR